MTDAELQKLDLAIRYLANSPSAVPIDQYASDLLVPLASALGLSDSALRDGLRDRPALVLTQATKFLAENSSGPCPPCPDCPRTFPSGDPVILFGGTAGYTIVDTHIGDEYAWLVSAEDLALWGAGSSTPGWYFYDGVVTYVGAGPTLSLAEHWAFSFTDVYIYPSGVGSNDSQHIFTNGVQWDDRLRFGKAYPGPTTWLDNTSFNWIAYP